MLSKIEDGHDVGMRHLSGHPRLLMHPQISRKSDPHSDTAADVLLDRRVNVAHGAAPNALADGVTPDARRMAVVVAHPARFLQKLQWPGAEV